MKLRVREKERDVERERSRELKKCVSVFIFVKPNNAYARLVYTGLNTPWKCLQRIILGVEFKCIRNIDFRLRK